MAVALATQADGSVIVHEWMFESRLIFTDKLQLMGAAITICDPHRAIIVGPAQAARRSASIRPTSAPGWRCCSPRSAPRATTEIGNVRHIDRGYERIDERLRALGARIERVEDTAAQA